jgi:predicted short-subunit dehydrogenase-like oxidoreductase (DUF2520 family)
VDGQRVHAAIAALTAGHLPLYPLVRGGYCSLVRALPLGGLTFSLLGPGRVGQSLAAWAVAAGAHHRQTAGRGGAAVLITESDDLLLLAVPDGALPEVARELAGRPQARVVLHTAGALDAGVLAPLAAGSAVGTLHPLKAFPRPLLDPVEAHRTFFALDGDPAALDLGRRLAAAWGGVAAEVPPAARPLYHLAATWAAGGVVTLLAAAGEIAERLGLPPEVAAGYLELARGALAAAGDGPAERFLTGPVARGDAPAVARLLDALAAFAPEKLPLALELARETLRQHARGAEPGSGHVAVGWELDRVDRLRRGSGPG